MAEQKVYPKGLRFFPKNPKAPEFVLGSMVITINQFIQFLEDNPGYLTEYKGEKQIRLQVLNGKDGIYATVDTWKSNALTPPAPTPKAQPERIAEDSSRDLPF